MTSEPIVYSEMTSPRPEYAKLEQEYQTLLDRFEAAEVSSDHKAAIAAIDAWDKLRRQISTFGSLARLKFNQDTSNSEYEEAREYVDELMPKVTEFDVKMMRALLDSSLRSRLEDELGEHAFRLWSSEVTTYEPEIQDDLAVENKLRAEYTKLCASAEIEFRGETYNLSGIRKFMDVADRDTRHEAQKARWQWFEAHGDEFDRLYDELTQLRHGMATKLGYEDFVDLGYRRMSRIDYDRADVETFRAEVQQHVVPLVADIREAQRERLGLDELMVWDEDVHDLEGNPTPIGDVEELTAKAREMFSRLHPELGEFFAMMDDRQLLDLDTRKAKSGGGFCTWFADYQVPYIFANFNGSKHDAEVFTHEMGHAFQCYVSGDKRLLDYVWPTYESCEIHSMSLEFLTWPHIDLLFGDDAERFKKIHLIESFAFIPYGTAVDHFQHLVYENPEATAEERHAMWKQMEETYLPWRNWGDIDYGAKGARWHLQSHIFGMPFYYIDYVLALTCALQFWERMQQDFDRALDDYVELCKLGGEAAFQTLARSAGLTSPFERGSLETAVERARTSLGL